MIWLTWRQHRVQALAAAAMLAALAAVLLPTGAGFSSAFAEAGLATCDFGTESCRRAAAAFIDRYAGLQFVIPLFLFVPALVGLFWGAPLIAREVEHGTHRLAWTQGVTRLRWITTKIVSLAVAAIALGAVLSVLLTWWSRPFVIAGDSRFSPGPFDLTGVVVMGYALFSFAVGVAAGAFLRRTIPAMGAALAVFVAVRAAVAFWLRPRFMSPKTLSYPMNGSRPRWGLGDWTMSTATVDRSGAVIDQGITFNYSSLVGRCPDLPPPGDGFPPHAAIEECIRTVGLHVRELYQPAERFWAFQAIESSIFVVLAVALLVFIAHRIGRRPT